MIKKQHATKTGCYLSHEKSNKIKNYIKVPDYFHDTEKQKIKRHCLLIL